MKKLRFFGLLAAALLLAFGLMVGCSSDTPTDDTDEVKTEFSGMSNGQLVVFTFSNKALAAGARAAGPNSGDNYLITIGGSKVSSGYITMPTTDVIEFHPDDDQPPFQASLGNNTIVLNDTVGGSALNVTASPGTGGGGGGGGGTTTPPTGANKKPLISYAVVADGTGGTTASTKITFDFSEPVDFNVNKVTITDRTGKAVKDGTIAPGTGNKWDLNLDDTQSKEGLVTVKVNITGVDPAERTVPIMGVLPTGASVKADTIKLLDGAGTPAAGKYFQTTTTKLEIVFAAAPTEFTKANVAWNTPIDKYGQQAEIGEISDFVVTNAGKTFTAAVTVKKQGPVEFYLIGEGFSPAITGTTAGAQELATKDETLKYTVYKGDNNGGKVRVVPLLTASAGDLQKVREGDVQVSIAKAGIDPGPQTIKVYRARLVTPDVTPSRCLASPSTCG